MQNWTPFTVQPLNHFEYTNCISIYFFQLNLVYRKTPWRFQFISDFVYPLTMYSIAEAFTLSRFKLAYTRQHICRVGQKGSQVYLFYYSIHHKLFYLQCGISFEFTFFILSLLLFTAYFCSFFYNTDVNLYAVTVNNPN